MSEPVAASAHVAVDERLAVVIVTHERRASLLRTLTRVRALPEDPHVVVVDNGSRDGSAGAVDARADPRVTVIALPGNRGAVARTVGVAAVAAPYVAFCDDDSWWEPGALARAAAAFDAHPRLGLVAARILVGAERRLDDTCAAMARSPLAPRPDVPGRPVLGFVACGAVVRRDAFLEVGGFEPRLGTGAEEALLALDLAARDWAVAYVPEVVAVHDPSPRGRPRRRQLELRNALWSTWLRRPLRSAIGRTLALGAAARGEPLTGARALAAALAGLPWVMRARRPIPPALEASLRMVERAG